MCRKYGWKKGADHKKICTRAGMMDLTTGKAVIKKHAMEGWQEALWDMDNRGAYGRRDEHLPRLDAHEAYYASADTCVGEWTPPGILLDHRTGRLPDQMEPPCACGVLRPERRHLAWRCPILPPNTSYRPVPDIEERLMVPLVHRKANHLEETEASEVPGRLRISLVKAEKEILSCRGRERLW